MNKNIFAWFLFLFFPLVLLSGCASSVHEFNLQMQQQQLRSQGYDMSIDEIDKQYPEWRRMERNKSQTIHTK